MATASTASEQRKPDRRSTPSVVDDDETEGDAGDSDAQTDRVSIVSGLNGSGMHDHDKDKSLKKKSKLKILSTSNKKRKIKDENSYERAAPVVKKKSLYTVIGKLIAALKRHSLAIIFMTLLYNY